MVTKKNGNALVQTQKNNFAPRVGFAYQATPRLVVRGGLGLFYNSFENQGYGPNVGENYPFVFNFNYTPQVAPGQPIRLADGRAYQLRHTLCRAAESQRSIQASPASS